MNYLLDTNVLITYIRSNKYSERIDEVYNPLSFGNTSIISVVSIGEIKSIALQNNWGIKKQKYLKMFFEKFLIADINATAIIDRYAEIDAFSQNKLKQKSLNTSSRNMGKNDLWIAATASVLDAKLLTLDRDFNHLTKEYLDLELIVF